MKENDKNKIILILGLLTIILLIFLISSCQDAALQRKIVNQERQSRMQLEERLLSVTKRNADLTQGMDQLQERFNQEILKIKGELEIEPKLGE